MMIKLCGINTRNNFLDLDKLDLDMIGLNFYPASSRYVEDNTAMADLAGNVPTSIKKAGVFVHEELDEVEWRAASFSLDYLQLHGDEDLSYCTAAQQIGKVIKVFRIGKSFDFSIITPFESVASYFIFDTDTEEYGGSGTSFDWSLLQQYRGQTKFLIAGGISPNDVEKIKVFKHPAFAGIDINSQFEFAKGNKDMRQVYEFINALKA